MNFVTRLTIPISLFLLRLNSITSEKIEVGVGDEICVGGFVMDTFCIELGVLFDNPSVRTLGPDGPTRHSVHCLVDVARCKNSPYEFLEEMEDGTYGRAWRVDDNSLLLDHAKSVGVCTDCDVGNSESSGHLVRGYRAAVTATVKSLGDSTTPAVISVTSVSDFSELGALCEGKEYAVPAMVMLETTEGGVNNLVRVYLVHGILMIIGWGLLLPSGILIAKFGKHRPNAWWFKMHQILQPIGLLIALVGWAIALANFTTLGSGPGLPFSHALIGSASMGISISQSISGILRPKKEKDGEEKSKGRRIWEYSHRFLGWAALILSIVSCGIGTTLLPGADTQKRFQIAYGIIICGVAVLLPGFLLSEKDKYQNNEVKEVEKDEEDHK